jgi:hypothetical protein
MLGDKPATPEQREVQDVFKEVGQKLDGFDRAADIVDSFFGLAPASPKENMPAK